MSVTSHHARRRSPIPAWLDLGRFFADRRFALLWMSFVFIGLLVITTALSLLAAFLLMGNGVEAPLGYFVLALAAASFVLAIASGWTTLTKLAGVVIERRRARVR